MSGSRRPVVAMSLQAIRACVPPFFGTDTSPLHKGQSGRVAVVGGSLEYTGAPYFAAISALKVGADLAHVFCTKEAAPVIKSYSPELIVHPLLDGKNNNIEEIKTWLERIHAVVIGPGLGRDERILKTAAEIIKFCKQNGKPLVVDADGLFLINENLDLIKDYPLPGVILTPNKVEFERLHGIVKLSNSTLENPKIDYNKLGSNVVILRKGAADRTFCKDHRLEWSNDKGGSPRRCGGQGDLLSGSAATFFNWCIRSPVEDMSPGINAAYAAALLTRKCNEKGFAIKGRSMVCSDMIEKIHESFEELFESR